MGDEDGVDEILKLIIDRFIVFPPLKMKGVLWGFGSGNFLCVLYDISL